MTWFYIFGLLLCHSNRLTGLLSVALAHIKPSAHASLLPRVSFLSTLRAEHPCAEHLPGLPAQVSFPLNVHLTPGSPQCAHHECKNVPVQLLSVFHL